MPPRRHELSDDEWALVEPLLPPHRTRGTHHRDHRTLLNAMLYRLHTGVPWRDLPERYGPWQTAYSRFRRWSRDGTWDRLLASLQRDLDAAGGVDWTPFCLDGPARRARTGPLRAREKNRPPTEPADHALGRSRGGWGTKLHPVTDGTGLPLAVRLSAGQAHESRFATDALDAVRVARVGPGRPRQRPDRVAADKGYSYDHIRAWLRARDVGAVIPERRDQAARRAARPGRPLAFDREAYRRRNVVERCVGWLKEARAVATRFDKLAVHYLGVVKLAMARRLLRATLSNRP